MKLAAVMLNSENPKVLAEFYTKVFGEPKWAEDDWFGYDTGSAHLMVAPHSEIKGKNTQPARVILNFETDDVATEAARLKEIGAGVIAEPYQPDPENSPKMWIATFADPDGNYIQVTTPMEV